MSNSIRILLTGMTLIALLGVGTNVHAQAATDVDCNNCVDKPDIAPAAITTGKIKDGAIDKSKIEAGAITTGKIKDQAVTKTKIEAGAVTSGKIKAGAVTPDKVAPPLKNAIGTFCPPGEFVVGISNDGNLVCESAT